MSDEGGLPWLLGEVAEYERPQQGSLLDVSPEPLD